MIWAELRALLRDRLAAGGSESPGTEARWIVEHLCASHDGTAVDDDEAVPAPVVTRALEMSERRAAGEPLQYVLGTWPFRDFEVMVDSRVLVPRPETEVTAEVAIEEAGRLGFAPGRGDPWAEPAGGLIVDLGTGSGVIALTLARALADAQIWASDASDAALAVASANVAGAGTIGRRIRLAQGDWFDALPVVLRGQVQLVVTNPPYVSEAEFADLPEVIVHHEPRDALVAGRSGLEAIEVIVCDASRWLAPQATLVVEIAPHQADIVTELARRSGFDDVVVRPDLTGRPRILVARRYPRS
jgi:release factor glutamine methyltransferase